MKKYFAYQTTTMEKFDSVITTSRIKAARYFASKKDIDLKMWLEFNSVLEQEDFKMYFKSTLIFNRNMDQLIYENKIGSKYFIRIDNSIAKNPKIIKFYKFKSFLNFMFKSGWCLDIIPTKTQREFI